MTIINDFIDAGNLEQHCFEFFETRRADEIAELLSAHPQIKQELNQIEETIELLAKSQAIEPRQKAKQRFLSAIGFSPDEALDISNLPPTGKYSSYTSWYDAVEHLIPAQPFEDFFMQVLRQDEHIAQMLVVTRLDVPQEIHETVKESFFILEGSCVCTVGEDVFTLNPGDYLEIPLHVKHNIKIVSPHVIAILQHQFA
jgi:mannose-6-phosphate isomerase-like protein (cupin superfamily)